MRTVYHGIDLHSNNLKVHSIEQEDERIVKQQIRTIYLFEYEKKLLPILSKNDYVCLEASTGAFAFSQMIESYVKKCSVINPFLFKALYLTGVKNDKIDAKKLSEKLLHHVKMNEMGFDDNFPEVYVPNNEIIELRSLFSTYDALKKQKTALTNRIHSIIKQNLIVYNSNQLKKEIDRIEKEGVLKKIFVSQIRILNKQMESLSEEMEILKEMIKKIAYTHYKKELEILISIVGISFFTACAIIADIGDIKRFKNHKKLCSYLRAGMRVDSSNDKTYNGKINKRARKRSFSMILQGLHHVVRYNPAYQHFQTQKTKAKGKNKVRCALVRKTIVAIFYMLKNQEVWKYNNENNYSKKIKKMNKEMEKVIDKEKRA